MRLALLFTLCTFGCEPADDESGVQAFSQTDGGTDAGDAGAEADLFGFTPTVDAAPPSGDGAWVAVIDLTQGVGIGALFGADVDAIGYTCPGGASGWAVEIGPGTRTAAAEEFPGTPALGPPDGPCDPITDCTAPVGLGGTLMARVDAPSLAGCTVTVHEHADRGEEQFEVWTCAGPDLNDCGGPWFGGVDGETASGQPR